MIVTIHQPEHLPYFGFLDKVKKADLLVLLDDVQFKKNNFQNRNRILTPLGVRWLTVPVNLRGFLNGQFADICTAGEWKTKYRAQIYEAYHKHPYFDEQMPWIDEMLKMSSDKVIDYNLFAIRRLLTILRIDTPVVLSSEMEIGTTKTQRLYDICHKCGATAYLAGQGAMDYLDVGVFGGGIGIIKHEFAHPTYNQRNQSYFVSHLSIVDALMNIGTGKTTGLFGD